MTRLLRLTDTQHANLLAILAKHRRDCSQNLSLAQATPRPLGPELYPEGRGDGICPPTALELQLTEAKRLTDDLLSATQQAMTLRDRAVEGIQIKVALVHPTIDGCVLVLADHRAVVQRPDVDDVIVADIVEALAVMSPAPITVGSSAGVVSVAPPEEVEQWTQLTDFSDTVYTLPVQM